MIYNWAIIVFSSTEIKSWWPQIQSWLQGGSHCGM